MQLCSSRRAAAAAAAGNSGECLQCVGVRTGGIQHGRQLCEGRGGIKRGSGFENMMAGAVLQLAARACEERGRMLQGHRGLHCDGHGHVDCSVASGVSVDLVQAIQAEAHVGCSVHVGGSGAEDAAVRGDTVWS